MTLIKNKEVEHSIKGSEDINLLFGKYIEICNTAIKNNKDRFPYKHIWQAGFGLVNGKDIEFTVFDDQPQGKFVVNIYNNLLVLSPGGFLSDRSWKLLYSNIRRVIDNPDEYINNPSLLDWGWLTVFSDRSS